MKNSEQPIYPCMMQQIGDDSYRAHKEGDPREWKTPMAGLTKREYFAAMAMQGIMANPETVLCHPDHYNNIAQTSIRTADELLKQLES